MDEAEERLLDKQFLDLKGSQSILQYSKRLEAVINITNLNLEQ